MALSEFGVLRENGRKEDGRAGGIRGVLSCPVVDNPGNSFPTCGLRTTRGCVFCFRLPLTHVVKQAS